MRRIVTFSCLAIGVVVGVLIGSSAGQSSPLQAAGIETVAVPATGEIEVVGTVDSADEEAVDWAIDRYREARLSLPRIRVSFHRNSDPCEGAQGGYLIEDGVSRVLICVSESGSLRELKLKRTLLHEFAHAWDAHFLTEEVRKEFIERRGLEEWSTKVPYEERGSEHAAETITWGLMDEPLLFGSLDEATSWHLQHEGYLALTGVEPPHGYVWSLFAAGHDVYARTPAQLAAVKDAWDLSEELGRRTERIEVRFHRTAEPCGGEVATSRLIGDRLHIQACPNPDADLSAALLGELAG